MKISNYDGTLSSTWYTKPTDTGLVMNFHSLAPKKYKRSVISGFVHRIFRSCSSWKSFHASLQKAKDILELNQYPSDFYEPIINKTLTKILDPENNAISNSENSILEESFSDQSVVNPMCLMDEKAKFRLFVQYRGKVSENYAHELHKIHAPCRIIMTLRKIKTVLPSLKCPVEKMLKSNVVYQIVCPRCESCYVGQTSRQMQRRFSEHLSKGPIKAHMEDCTVMLTPSDVNILGSTTRGEKYLLTLEALHQNELQPSINTKDEFRSRTLTIKF